MMAVVRKNGCLLRYKQPFFLCLLFFVFSILIPASHADQNHLEEQLKYATPELRLQLIDKLQPNYSENPETWLAWEHKRFTTMVELGAWQQIRQRIADLNLLSDERVTRWMKRYQALSLLKTSRPEEAREVLADLLWRSDSASTEQIAEWRQMIIRSYLASNRYEDARRAMLRYRQDYGEQGLEWKILQTKVLLGTKRYEQAVNLLVDEKDPQAAPLILLSRFRAGLDTADNVYKKALSHANTKKKIPDQLRRQYWIVALIAAQQQKYQAAQIKAIENILISGNYDPDSDLVEVTADTLWGAYLQYGQQLGNRLHLLVGADEHWYKAASDRFDKHPVQARALFAVIGTTATADQHRDLAHKQLVALLLKQPQGLELIERLFTHSKRFRDIQEVPIAVRHQLVDYALSRGRIKQAANLLQGLEEPPDIKDKFSWHIRRARVLVLGGRYQQGADVLAAMLRLPGLTAEQLTQLMQVMFDLQNVQQHQLAIQLFDEMEHVVKDASMLRELKFWQAQSYQGIEDYAKAAHLYLTSAMMIPEKTGDPWSQTAQYKAAEALTQAGLVSDARSLYQHLLKITEDNARKSVIRQRLQHLWLLEGQKEQQNEQSNSAN